MKDKLLILSLILSMFATSCASRKVNKSETKEAEIKTEVVNENSNTKVNENTKVIDTSTIDEIEIVPVDNSKPIVVNGKIYLNAKIRHSKKKNNITTNKVIKVEQNANKQAKKEVKRNKSVEVKQVDKKANYFWVLWLFYIALYLFIDYKFKLLIFRKWNN